MKPAEVFLSKADLAVADLTSSGGELVPAQAIRFIRLLISEAVLVKEANIPPMKSKKQKINTIRFGSRVLRAASEGTALAAGDRSKPDITEVELDTNLMKAEARWTDEVLEDNIERQALQNTILTELANRASLDVDELVALGDTASADTYLVQLDGLIKTLATNVVAKSPIGALTQPDFADAKKGMPKEFQREFSRMRWYSSTNAETDYRLSLSDRATPQGDQHTQRMAPITPMGIPFVSVPVFPENLGGGTNETVLILTTPKNMNVGFWRKMKLERDKDVSAGTFLAVLSLRMDFKMTHEPAGVKLTGVLV